MKVDFEITYKNYEKLARFMNDRAKVQGRKRTGLTAKKQKKITQAIKRARHLGLLPFKARV
jgi:small subunit ribosomal protein S18